MNNIIESLIINKLGLGHEDKSPKGSPVKFVPSSSLEPRSIIATPQITAPSSAPSAPNGPPRTSRFKPISKSTPPTPLTSTAITPINNTINVPAIPKPSRFKPVRPISTTLPSLQYSGTSPVSPPPPTPTPLKFGSLSPVAPGNSPLESPNFTNTNDFIQPTPTPSMAPESQNMVIPSMSPNSSPEKTCTDAVTSSPPDSLPNSATTSSCEPQPTTSNAPNILVVNETPTSNTETSHSNPNTALSDMTKAQTSIPSIPTPARETPLPPNRVISDALATTIPTIPTVPTNISITNPITPITPTKVTPATSNVTATSPPTPIRNLRHISSSQVQDPIASISMVPSSTTQSTSAIPQDQTLTAPNQLTPAASAILNPLALPVPVYPSRPLVAEHTAQPRDETQIYDNTEAEVEEPTDETPDIDVNIYLNMDGYCDLATAPTGEDATRADTPPHSPIPISPQIHDAQPTKVTDSSPTYQLDNMFALSSSGIPLTGPLPNNNRKSNAALSISSDGTNDTVSNDYADLYTIYTYDDLEPETSNNPSIDTHKIAAPVPPSISSSRPNPKESYRKLLGILQQVSSNKITSDVTTPLNNISTVAIPITSASNIVSASITGAPEPNFTATTTTQTKSTSSAPSPMTINTNFDAKMKSTETTKKRARNGLLIEYFSRTPTQPAPFVNPFTNHTDDWALLRNGEVDNIQSLLRASVPSNKRTKLSEYPRITFLLA